jgi:aspartyl-tRNA(Asn)/glutamyl-tRNA(Gln) amidotransferase subunit B
VRRPGEPLGTRREIKNLNSFRFMQQAIEYEVQWQIEQIEDGGKIHQATVLFDPDTGETRAMRSKEDAHDYRYFPDPDLPPLVIAADWIERVRAKCRSCRSRCRRAAGDCGLSPYDATGSPRAAKWRVLPRRAGVAGAAQADAAAKLLRQLGDGRTGRAPEPRGADIAASPVTPRSSPAWWRASPTTPFRTTSPRRCSTRCGAAKAQRRRKFGRRHHRARA